MFHFERKVKPCKPTKNALPRCQLLNSDTAFIRKLEAMPDCYALLPDGGNSVLRIEHWIRETLAILTLAS